MGRLIDAEKITEVDCRGLEGYVKPEHYEIVASFFFEKFINCQPTAYDVDKVVATVREDCYAMGFDESMAEIIVEDIRKGGVSE